MKTLFSAVYIFTFLFLTNAAWSEGGVDAGHRDGIQRTMTKHIQDLTELNGNGKYPMFDPKSKTLVQLTFKGLHDSVEMKGRDNPYLVSCADFVADDGTLYDIDFFVSTNYGVVATLIHAKGGKKTSYDIH